ncbi:uncharacterized protein LTR77_002986 [Saxophila tyrrhenica]|uniref:Uncharacterized protein n=1 Tax=Saxophila tyrrhenica TaxID=1690608 RepID=A0AAV9PG56_9PEZI|nr:hypothetical protein LTR77_002986 [Saxophila tyrrhenica]
MTLEQPVMEDGLPSKVRGAKDEKEGREQHPREYVARQTTKQYKLTTFSSSTQATPAKSSDSVLMRLPAELRNTIYELVLLQDEKVIVTSLRRSPRGRSRTGNNSLWLRSIRQGRGEPDLSLLSVSKQVRQETLSIFYRGHRFYISILASEMNHVYSCLKSLSAQLGDQWPALDSLLSRRAGPIGSAPTRWLRWPHYKDKEPSNLPFPTSATVSKIGRQLQEVVRVGEKARQSGASVERLEMHFRDWVFETARKICRESVDDSLQMVYSALERDDGRAELAWDEPERVIASARSRRS